MAQTHQSRPKSGAPQRKAPARRPAAKSQPPAVVRGASAVGRGTSAAVGGAVRSVGTGAKAVSPDVRRDGAAVLLLIGAILVAATEWFGVGSWAGTVIHAVSAGLFGMLSKAAAHRAYRARPSPLPSAARGSRKPPHHGGPAVPCAHRRRHHSHRKASARALRQLGRGHGGGRAARVPRGHAPRDGPHRGSRGICAGIAEFARDFGDHWHACARGGRQESGASFPVRRW